MIDYTNNNITVYTMILQGIYDNLTNTLTCQNIPAGNGSISVSLYYSVTNTTLLSSSIYTYNNSMLWNTTDVTPLTKKQQYCIQCGITVSNLQVCGTIDCNGIVDGTAYIDDCNNCINSSTVGRNTGNDIQNCFGICYGQSISSAVCNSIVQESNNMNCMFQYSTISSSNTSSMSNIQSYNYSTYNPLYMGISPYEYQNYGTTKRMTDLSMYKQGCTVTAVTYKQSVLLIDNTLYGVDGYRYMMLIMICIVLCIVPLIGYYEEHVLRRYYRRDDGNNNGMGWESH
jgi:hypothetical protein